MNGYRAGQPDAKRGSTAIGREEPPAGLIFNVQRFCLHDGPGVRTVIFLKGCSLRCEWCCNPESQSPLAEVLFDAGRCIGCGKCVEACPHEAIIAPPAPERIDRALCHLSGKCAAACPTGAIRMAGTRKTVEDALSEALEDRNYYAVSGGGVTLSGGEPLLQADFAAALLEGLKRQGIHTAIETAGFVPWSAFEDVHEVTDLYLFDIKHANDERHRTGTGRSNRLIQQNLRRFAGSGAKIVLRYVLLPGYNMDDDALHGLAELAGGVRLLELELLSFHRLGAGKYLELGRLSSWRHESPPPPEEVRAFRDRLATLLHCTVRIG